MSRYLILGGSPQTQGKTAHIIDALNTALLSKTGVTTEVFSVTDYRVEPCCGCESCKVGFRCIINDDMTKLYSLLDAADDLVIVSPVFFAGPPAQFKAVLDRLQPYFWKWTAGLENKNSTENASGGIVSDKHGDRALESGGGRAGSLAAKRSASLYVVGEGGDPHGFEPLVVSTRSALAVAGFRLTDIFAFIGQDLEKISMLIEQPEDFRYRSHADD